MTEDVPGAYSGAKWSPILELIDQWFWNNLITHSGNKWSFLSDFQNRHWKSPKSHPNALFFNLFDTLSAPQNQVCQTCPERVFQCEKYTPFYACISTGVSAVVKSLLPSPSVTAQSPTICVGHKRQDWPGRYHRAWVSENSRRLYSLSARAPVLTTVL